jgi:membrane fusion protein (multidrug efflux system)
MAEHERGSGGDEAARRASVVVTAEPQQPPRVEPAGPPPRRRGRGWLILGAVAAVAVGLFFWKGRPWLENYFRHVETDDAYVTGEPTVVPARVGDVVEAVLVENTDFVERGTVLVRLDRVPYELAVQQRRTALAGAKLEIDQQVAALEAARADLERARDMVRGQLAALRASWHAVEGAQEQVRYRVASLRAALASQRAAQADAELARKEADRVRRLVEQNSATREELDQKHAQWQSAQEQVKAAEQRVQQARALLALRPDAEHPERVPADLERTDTDVRRAVAAGQEILAQLNVPIRAADADPEGLQQTFKSLLGGSSAAFDQVPAVRAARAKVDQVLAALGGPSFDPAKRYEHPSVVRAQKDLEQAELQLGYTEIRAPVSGFVDRKAVNPGDHVQAGQGLMRLQPLEGVYIMANFREIQLNDLRIGQPVEIRVDAYGHRTFKGRVSGFAPATGAASSLLPPENATGNFVKVVQRLPVRIDLSEPNPPEAPLYVGLSVVPEVDIKAEPSGPHAGERLRGTRKPGEVAAAPGGATR